MNYDEQCKLRAHLRRVRDLTDTAHECLNSRDPQRHLRSAIMLLQQATKEMRAFQCEK